MSGCGRVVEGQGLSQGPSANQMRPKNDWNTSEQMFRTGTWPAQCPLQKNRSVAVQIGLSEKREGRGAKLTLENSQVGRVEGLDVARACSSWRGLVHVGQGSV
jgi:hypothetical protein